MSFVWLMCLTLTLPLHLKEPPDEDTAYLETIQETHETKTSVYREENPLHYSPNELEDRLPRSAPDALRFEPGVFVQQTAHSQGSAFIQRTHRPTNPASL